MDGRPVNFHYGGGGAEAGYSAAVRILPDRGIAFLAFANASSEFNLDGTENEAFTLLDTIIDNLHGDPDVQGIAADSVGGAS